MHPEQPHSDARRATRATKAAEHYSDADLQQITNTAIACADFSTMLEEMVDYHRDLRYIVRVAAEIAFAAATNLVPLDADQLASILREVNGASGGVH